MSSPFLVTDSTLLMPAGKAMSVILLAVSLALFAASFAVSPAPWQAASTRAILAESKSVFVL